ncbi:hypothetical protein A6R68_13784 [Neotoma lepida]|uniref:Uncharacterized protein n=1 Tax=Neotoma lepida TaxID=56216 RepID=A0A1A6H064_NEOLE|nr:hypothetical protein A6R68_13784 [Neotoma lepida]
MHGNEIRYWQAERQETPEDCACKESAVPFNLKGIIWDNPFKSVPHDSEFPLRVLYINQSESAFSKHRHHIKPSNRCPLHRSWSRTNTVEKS